MNTAYSYDSVSRLLSVLHFLPSRTFTNSYTYDAASNRVAYTDPEGGTAFYAYDTLHRLTGINSSNWF